MFSPCLQRYIWLDKKENQLVIKGNYNGQELYRIPKDIVEVDKKESKPSIYTNRIKWIDSNKL
jgi:hypothetical protein